MHCIKRKVERKRKKERNVVKGTSRKHFANEKLGSTNAYSPNVRIDILSS